MYLDLVTPISACHVESMSTVDDQHIKSLGKKKHHSKAGGASAGKGGGRAYDTLVGLYSAGKAATQVRRFSRGHTGMFDLRRSTRGRILPDPLSSHCRPKNPNKW